MLIETRPTGTDTHLLCGGLQPGLVDLDIQGVPLGTLVPLPHVGLGEAHPALAWKRGGAWGLVGEACAGLHDGVAVCRIQVDWTRSSIPGLSRRSGVIR